MVVTRFSNSTWQIGRIFDRVRPFTAIIATTIIATTIILESTKISRSGIRPGRRSLPTLILTIVTDNHVKSSIEVVSNSIVLIPRMLVFMHSGTIPENYTIFTDSLQMTTKRW